MLFRPSCRVELGLDWEVGLQDWVRDGFGELDCGLGLGDWIRVGLGGSVMIRFGCLVG